jgi:hypothetical protein
VKTIKPTEIPEEFLAEYEAKFLPRKLTTKEIEADPVLWADMMLGIRLRVYQAWVIKLIMDGNKRIAICTGRQLGKSMVVAIFTFWATYYNKFPATVENITAGYIVSRDDDTATELIEKIRGLVKGGDRVVFAKKHIEHYFSSKIVKPKTQHQITWENRSFIKSTPPTDTIVGKSASIFFIDEAAKLKVTTPYTDRRLFYEVIEPTTSQTNGTIIVASTPNGIGNWFADIFDPDEKQEKHEFIRVWYPYTISKDESYINFVKDKQNIMEQRGELRLWQQEYMASFQTTQQAFFDPKDIDKAIDTALSIHYDWRETDCSMGIDYGMSESRTVITIKTLLNGVATTLNQIRFPKDFDENLLMDNNYENSIPSLMRRYKIRFIVADRCPGGDMTNKWMKNQGYPIKEYNFRTNQVSVEDMNRNKGFYKYRTALKCGKIRFPLLTELINEMKILEEVQLVINISIRPPKGMLSDCIDSELMAAIPLIGEDTGVGSFVVSNDNIEGNSAMIDTEWDDMRIGLDNTWQLR